MTNEINVNEILNTYTEKEQKIIAFEIRIRALIGGGRVPQTDEEFKEFCDKVLADRKAKEEKAEKAKQRKIDNEKRRA